RPRNDSRRKTCDHRNAKKLRDRRAPLFPRGERELNNLAESLALVVISRKLETERGAAWIEQVYGGFVAAAEYKVRKQRQRRRRGLLQRSAAQNGGRKRGLDPLPRRNLRRGNEFHIPFEGLASKTIARQEALKCFGSPHSAAAQRKSNRHAA